MADENEIMLELSIGGIFAKQPNINVTEFEKRDEQIERLKRGYDQANRRRKREEIANKLGDFGSCGSVSGPFVENKDWLEAQIVGQGNEPLCKREKKGNYMHEKAYSVLSASIEDNGNFVLRPMACRNFKPYEGNMNIKANEDGQFSSKQGGASDDTRSNSSNSQLDHQPASTSTTSVEPSDQHQPTGSLKPTLSTTKLVHSTMKPNDRSNPHESSVPTPPSKPEPNSQDQQTSLLARMPCVSTTGNGPNGKTVSGFLYRYTKKEVCIVCVCHGRSFSPAGFVEHAGGVDVANPLKHITIFPAAFAS